MFVLIRPQVARHTSGIEVRIASRHSVELAHPDGTVDVAEAEMGAVAYVFLRTLERRGADGSATPISEHERISSATRMVEGLRAMGAAAELG